MKHHSAIILVLVIFLGTSLLSSANAEERNWKGGIRIGPSFTSGTVVDRFDYTGEIGPIVNAHFFYKINKYFYIGPMIEYEYHSLESKSSGGGDIGTFSLLPIVLEAGPGRIGDFEPYGTIGAGWNFNRIYDDDRAKSNADGTFAFRIGAGTDYYLLEWLALNVEFAWKSNAGSASYPRSNNRSAVSSDFNASSASLLFGARVAF